MLRTTLPVRLAALLAALACARPAFAAEAQRLVAILTLQTNENVSEDQRTSFEEAIRIVAGDLLGTAKFTVLTGENTLRILVDNGIDQKKGCEATCELDSARELKLDYFVSGRLMLVEDAYLAQLRLSSTKTGAQVGAVMLEGRSVRDLRHQFSEKACGMFARGLEVDLPACRVAPKVEPPKEVKIDPRIFEDEPDAAVVEKQPEAAVVEKKPDATVVEKKPAPRPPAAGSPMAALRAGAGTHLGIVGVGLEFRLKEVGDGLLRLGLGSGTHLFSGGLSWAPRPLGESGYYVDVHFAYVQTGFLAGPIAPGVGFGATAGWELYPLSWLSVKAGAGVAYTTSRGPGLALDLAAGPVF